MNQPIPRPLLALAGVLIVASTAAAAAPNVSLPANGARSNARDQVAHDSALPAPSSPLLVDIAPCPGPDCPFSQEPRPIAQGQRVLFLNFDGVNIEGSFSDDATANRSRILNASSLLIPPLTVDHLMGASTDGWTIEEIKEYVVDTVKLHMGPYNVRIVTDRPSSGLYHQIVFSPEADCLQVAGRDCAGIAPLDCGDDNPVNVVWVFARNLRVLDLATTASHEAAHSLGLGHTNDSADIMFPSITQAIPTAFGAGSLSDGGACVGGGFQDSDGLMLDTIGASAPDTTPPAVEITRPAPGLAIGGGAIIEVRVIDEASAVGEVDLYLNGELYRAVERNVRPFEFVIPPSTDVGPLVIRAVARDIHGNESEVTVEAEFKRGGAIPCTNDVECDNGWDCDGQQCVLADPNSGQLGAECESNADCLVGACGSLGAESRCTQECNDSNPCPDGFDCRGGSACWPADGGGGSGCSAGGHGTPAAVWTILVFAFVLVRRRH